MLLLNLILDIEFLTQTCSKQESKKPSLRDLFSMHRELKEEKVVVFGWLIIWLIVSLHRCLLEDSFLLVFLLVFVSLLVVIFCPGILPLSVFWSATVETV